MGKLIVIEGACDGIGKSTQFNLLKEYFHNNYPDLEIVSHHFPSYETPQGKCVEMYLNGEFGSPSELSPYFINALYAIDRAVTWNLELKKIDDQDGLILLDRYTTSSIIYQSAFIKNENDKKAFIDYITDFEYNKLGIKEPTNVIFLTAPYDLVAKMRHDRNQSTDVYEKDDNLQRLLYENALFIANYLNWTIINCEENGKMKSIEDIHEDIVNNIQKTLTMKR